MKIFIGIDNSKLTHYVNIIDENGKKLKELIIENTLKGFQLLLKELKKYKKPYIGFEVSHGHFVEFLKHNGYTLYNLNPLKVKRFKQSYSVSGNKSDKIDAYALALYLRANHEYLKPIPKSSPKIVELDGYRATHERLVKSQTKCINRLIFVLKEYFPLLNDLFSSSTPMVLLQLILKYPTWEELKMASKSELLAFFKQNHYKRTKSLEKIMDKIADYDQVIPNEVVQAYQIEARALAQMLITIKENLKDLINRMSKILDEHSLGKVFLSLPGAGVVIAAKLLALMKEDKDRFKNPQELQCLFGTAPQNYQSGNCHIVIHRRACNKSAKHLLYNFAFSSMRMSKWARDYYDNQKSKGKKHSVAVRALSNRWLKKIYFLWKNEVLYDESMVQKHAA